MIPSFHWASTSSFSQILLKRLYSVLTVVSMSALMASAGILSGPAAFRLLDLCLWGFVAADGQFCLRRWDVWWWVRGGAVQQFPEVFCPSFQLFLGRCQWVPILVLYWLVFLMLLLTSLSAAVYSSCAFALAALVWLLFSSFPLSPCFLLVDGVGRDPFLVLCLLFAKDLFTCVMPELLAVFPLCFWCPSHCLLSALVAAGTCWKGWSGKLLACPCF